MQPSSFWRGLHRSSSNIFCTEDFFRLAADEITSSELSVISFGCGLLFAIANSEQPPNWSKFFYLLNELFIKSCFFSDTSCRFLTQCCGYLGSRGNSSSSWNMLNWTWTLWKPYKIRSSLNYCFKKFLERVFPRRFPGTKKQNKFSANCLLVRSHGDEGELE